MNDYSCADARSGTFTIGDDRFQASLLDLPCVLESYKTYDDNVLIKTADIGQVLIPWFNFARIFFWVFFVGCV